MEQSRLDDVLANERITSVNIVQPATLQMRPVSPNKPLCAVAGFLAAAALAISLPVLVEARNESQSNERGSIAGRRSESSEWEFAARERADSDRSGNSASDSDADSRHQEIVS